MKKLLYIIALVGFLSTSALADFYKKSLTLDPDILNEEISSNIEEETFKNPLFVHIGAGVSYVNIDSNVDSEKLAYTIGKTSSTVEFGLGVRVSQDIFLTAFMQKSYLNNSDITNIGISTNYQFDQTYIGLLGGESRLTWEKSPVINTLTEQKSQTQIFYGFQLGYDYELLYRLSLYTKYQLMFVNHQTNINNDSTIKHNIQNNLTTGVKYAF
ncbi:MAG TPA: hypothetical protein EYG69_05330 [Campylobacterales bacterium]|nr:hypothetical protein [Campylobacterales bacterium]